MKKVVPLQCCTHLQHQNNHSRNHKTDIQHHGRTNHRLPAYYPGNHPHL